MNPDDKISNLVIQIRKKLVLTPEQNIYLFVGDKLVKLDQVFEKIYLDKKQPDGFLYLTLDVMVALGF